MKLIHPNSTDTVRFIITGDWSQLKEKTGIYDSVNFTFDALRETMNPNGILITGDIAYDLDTDNGSYYEEFL